jgi:hypothetical protein
MIQKNIYVVYNKNKEIIFIHFSKRDKFDPYLAQAMDNFSEKTKGIGWLSFCPKQEIDENSAHTMLGRKIEIKNNTAYVT